jgi:SNF2 family DNA or RNA helicase
VQVLAKIEDDRLLVQVPPAWGHRLKPLPGARWLHDRQVWALPVTPVSFALLEATFPEEVRLHPDTEVTRAGLLQQLERIEEAKGQTSPPVIEGLWPHQSSAARWIAAVRRCVLADEPGVGKTATAIAAARLLDEWPVLVIAPATLLQLWAREWERWGPPGLDVRVASGPKNRRDRVLREADVAIISWDALRHHTRLAAYGSLTLSAREREPKACQEREWGFVVADEAHRGKDPRALRTRAWWWVSHHARASLALTGTPVGNNVLDLWSLLHGVAPDEWPSRTKFQERWTNWGANWAGFIEVHGWKPETHDELQRLIRPRFHRRSRSELLDLPPKIHTEQRVEMEGEQRRMYDLLRREILLELEEGTLLLANPAARLMHLHRAAAAVPVFADGRLVGFRAPSVKLDALLDRIEEGRTPLVVWAASRLLVEWTAEQLRAAGIGAVTLTGRTPAVDRQRIVDDFQAGATEVLLATFGVGSEGISLTRASTAVILQDTWDVTARRQAEDRLHRPGQTSSTEIIDLITMGTVDERVAYLRSLKRAQFEMLVRDADWWKAEILSA